MFCNTCRAVLFPGDAVCRNCGAAVPQRHPDARFHLTLAIVVPLIFFLGVGLFFFHIKSKRASLQHRGEQFIKDRAVQLAGNYFVVTGKLGTPVRESCCVRYQRTKEGLWFEVPVEGTRGKGKLIGLSGSTDEFDLRSFALEMQGDPQPIDLLPSRKLVDRGELHGDGKVYLVPVGKQVISVTLLAEHYKEKFGLDVTVLPAVQPTALAYDLRRKQWIAEEMVEAMKQANPALALDQRAVVIGVTGDDIYMQRNGWNFTYSYRADDHLAIVSTARMDDRVWNKPDPHAPPDLKVITAKAEQMITKDIAVLFWKVPLSSDAKSILAEILTPDGRPDDITEADLHPELSLYGMSVGCPFVWAVHSRKSGRTRLTPIGTCDGPPPESVDDEILEVPLSYGYASFVSTDFSLPAPVPLVLRRQYLSLPVRGNLGNFGGGSHHSLNAYMTSDGAPSFQYVQIYDLEFFSYKMPRMTSREGNPGFKFSGTQAGSKFYRSVLYYENTKFRLDTLNGDIYWFLPCRSSAEFCYWDGFKTRDGRSLILDRAQDRLLQQASSGDAKIKFRYDDAKHVVEASATNGEWRKYSYDADGCLLEVKRPDRTATSYSYGPDCLLTGVAFKSADGKMAGNVKINYKNERVESIATDGGGEYHFRYRMGATQAAAIDVVTPSGAHWSLISGPNGYEAKVIP